MIRTFSKHVLQKNLVSITATQARCASGGKDVKETKSFVLSSFRGELQTELVFPYPHPTSQEDKESVSALADVMHKFFREVNNADKNDKLGEVEQPTLKALWELGAFGMQVPPDYGGLGLANSQYAVSAEIIGQYDLGLGITLGSHQSIGHKGILLFGTEEQKAKYLPRVTTGGEYASFALTEPASGSDAASIKTRAELSPDGKHYILNGSKIWISNGGISEIFTLFAKTVVKDPVTGAEKDKVTAFIVERGFGGVTSGPPENKMGIKASNTTEVFLDNVKVPVENVLGGVGNGFKVAMNILNNGRFGLAATMAGTQKFCIQKATDFAINRKQFGRTIDSYGSIQEKIGRMSTLHYVTESLAFLLAGIMDQGAKEYHIESAVAKVFSSDSAWWVCDEAIQVMGGMGFMRASSLERFMRDLRIFRIFEGANDILRLFIALNGIQHAGSHLKELQNALKNPTANLGLVLSESGKRVFRKVGLGQTPSFGSIVHPNLSTAAHQCAKSVEAIGQATEQMLMTHGKGIVEQQFLLTRLGNCAIDAYTMSVVLARCTDSLNNGLPTAAHEENMTKLWCHEASERVAATTRTLDSPNSLDAFKTLAAISKTVCQNAGPVHKNPIEL